MATDFTIHVEKGIPVPPVARRQSAGRKHRRWPFRQMEVGDSFFVPTDEPTKDASNLLTMAPRNYGIGVTCRRVDGGIRVWRTA